MRSALAWIPVALILASFGLFSFFVIARGGGNTPRGPLLPVSSDVQAEKDKDAIIRDANGNERRSREIYLIVYPTFVSSHLLDFSRNAQLIDEAAIPDTALRYILVHVSEEEITAVRDALSKDPALSLQV